MPTSKEYLGHILSQLLPLDDITIRQMMGEYIIYFRGRTAAYLCDDRLLIKPVSEAVKLMPSAPLAVPYEGAKPMLLAENTNDSEFLCRLFESIYPFLPERIMKKVKPMEVQYGIQTAAARRKA